MKIALPVANSKLCMHFGHCEVFRVFEVNENTKQILSEQDLTPPPHEPGLLPKWIKDQGVSLVLAGGMGQRAQNIFTSQNINVLTGIEDLDPKSVVLSYLNDNLKTGTNACDH